MVSPSMRRSLEDLHLQSLDIIYPGKETYPLGKQFRAVAASRIAKDLKKLKP